MDKKMWFREICGKNNLHITDDQLLQFDKFVTHLLEWNKKINLISRTDIDNIWSKHILGSISFLFTFSIDKSATIVDVGTGGGFPGIPLAIFFPNAKLTLVDSIKKKITVVKDIIKRLNLANVQAVNGRAEEINMNEEFRSSYDYVVARAVAPTKDMIRWCKPFLRTTNQQHKTLEGYSKNLHYISPGTIILLKGGDLTQEIEQAKLKTASKFIQDFPIVVDGIDPADSSDKRIMIIQP